MIAKVFYTKDITAAYLGKSVDIEDYAFVTSLEADSLEDVFIKMNRGSGFEDKELLKERRGFSAGDIVLIGGQAYCCELLGWKKVPQLVTHLLELEARSELARDTK